MATRTQYLKLHALVHSLWAVLRQFTVTNQNENRDNIVLKQETILYKRTLAPNNAPV